MEAKSHMIGHDSRLGEASQDGFIRWPASANLGGTNMANSCDDRASGFFVSFGEFAFNF